MHLDVQDLRNFYYRTQLGRSAQRALREQLLALWPDVTGQTVLGFGFAVHGLQPVSKMRIYAAKPVGNGCGDRDWRVLFAFER